MNKQNRFIDREYFDSCQRGGIEGEKGKWINKYKSTVTESHGDIKYSIENKVNNIITTVYGVRWVLEFWGVVTS